MSAEEPRQLAHPLHLVGRVGEDHVEAQLAFFQPVQRPAHVHAEGGVIFFAQRAADLRRPVAQQFHRDDGRAAGARLLCHPPGAGEQIEKAHARQRPEDAEQGPKRLAGSRSDLFHRSWILRAASSMAKRTAGVRNGAKTPSSLASVHSGLLTILT